MCEGCHDQDALATTATAYAATRLEVLKRLAPELAQLLAVEIQLRDDMKAAHQKGAKAAVARAVAVTKAGRGGVEAVLARLTDRVERAYNGAMIPPGSAALEGAIPKLYELGYTAAWRKATGQIKDELAIEMPVAKAEGDKPAEGPAAAGGGAGGGVGRTVAVKPSFDLVDEEAIQALQEHQVFWLGEHYHTALSDRVASVARTVLVEEGLGTVEAGEAMGKAMALEFGVDLPKDVPIPIGWNAGEEAYFEGLASNAATVGRAYGSTQAFARLGVTTLRISNPLDEKTCVRCNLMAGKVFRVEDAMGQMGAVLGATKPEGVRTIQPWLAGKWFSDNIPAGKWGLDSKEYAAAVAAGIVLPGYHLHCRCAVDVAHGAAIVTAPQG